MAETQRTLLAHADALHQFGVTLRETRPLQKDAGTTVSIIGLALAIADSLDDGVLRKLILYLRELGISRNEILRLRLSEPEDIDRILATTGQEHNAALTQAISRQKERMRKGRDVDAL